MAESARFREKIRSGHTCIGTVISFLDPAVSEVCAAAGYDFVWIDMEHQAMGIETALAHLMALRGTGTDGLVRVPCNDPNVIKPVLDMAPAGVIIPQIRNAQEAADAVAACRYPPRGCRGLGARRGVGYGALPFTEYLRDADRDPMVIVQIEHIDAVHSVDAILATEGLDGICIGPCDLSASMGKPGQTTDADVAAAIDTVLAAAAKTNVMTGIATGYAADSFGTWLDKGVQWICLEGDWIHLLKGLKTVVDGVRSVEAKRKTQ